MATKTVATSGYTAKDIQVLEGLQAVRRRPGMYIGSTDARGLHQIVWEVLDNSIDEAMAGACNRIDLAIQRNVKLKWPHNWQLQLRADLFNAFNAVIYNARNASAQFVSPSNMTLANAQFLSNGTVNPGRLQPDSARGST